MKFHKYPWPKNNTSSSIIHTLSSTSAITPQALLGSPQAKPRARKTPLKRVRPKVLARAHDREKPVLLKKKQSSSIADMSGSKEAYAMLPKNLD